MNKGYTIDIDTGGTFTDGYISKEDQIEWVKVDTTPHDLTVGFFTCLEEAAKKIGYETIEKLLQQTEVIRFSTTIGTNALIQNKGSKLGLIVSSGYKDNIYRELGDKNPVLNYILSPESVLEIRGRVDPDGKVVEAINEDEVRAAVKELLVRGARVIVLSLLDSITERKVKKVVEDDYPKHYLGSVPLLTSFEISSSSDNESRTNAALFDAYIHSDMERFLYSAKDKLAKLGYVKPMMVVHNWGGVTRLAKTSALHTINSGPAAGLFGAAFVGNLYSLDNILTFDMGGTSVDLGIVIRGKVPIAFESNIEGISLKVPLVTTRSIGAGGGSIAKVTDKGIEVGPESAGALPGPVCYDLGGTAPTVTDACVVLGYINPDYHLGGRKKLNANKAYDCIKTKVAQPLGLAVEEAALTIVKEQRSICIEDIRRLFTEEELGAKEVTMLSFGGGGGIHCSEIARALGIGRILVPPFASAFSAFGSSTMDIVHLYEAQVGVPLRSVSGEYLSDFGTINQVVARRQQMAIRDLRFEGVALEEITFDLSLEIRATGLRLGARLSFPKLRIEEQKDIKSVCQKLSEALRQSVKGEITLESILLKAVGPLPHSQLSSHPATNKKPDKALKGKRQVYWQSDFKETPVYEQRLLSCGNQVAGPAIIEGEDTTILIPGGIKYSVNKFLFGIVEGV